MKAFYWKLLFVIFPVSLAIMIVVSLWWHWKKSEKQSSILPLLTEKSRLLIARNK